MNKIFLFCFLLPFLFISPAMAGDAEGDGNPSYNASLQMDYTKNLSLCQEFMDILQLPENHGLVMSFEEYKGLKDSMPPTVREAFSLKVREMWQLVHIPENENFKNPNWHDLSDEEAHEKWGAFINDWGNAGKTSLRYGSDYILQKTRMDIDRDGYADTLYRQKGGVYEMMVQDDGSQFAERFNKMIYSPRWQAFYYKGKPYFIGRLLTLLYINEPKRVQGQFYWSGVCSYVRNKP